MRLPLIALLLVFSAVAVGSPFSTPNIQTNCPTPSTVGYYSINDITCETGNQNAWLQFDGFANSSSANNFVVQALANASDQGFYYPENLNGPLSFALGFEVQGFNEDATSVTFHVTESSTPQGNASITMYVCTVPLASCVSNPQSVTVINTANYPIVTVNFNATPSFGLYFIGNIDAASVFTQFEATIGTTTDGGGGGPLGGVPEPATPLLVGAGLLALGYIRKRTA